MQSRLRSQVGFGADPAAISLRTFRTQSQSFLFALTEAKKAQKGGKLNIFFSLVDAGLHKRFQSCFHQTSTVETTNSAFLPIQISPLKEKEQKGKVKISVQVILVDSVQLHSCCQRWCRNLSQDFSFWRQQQRPELLETQMFLKN